MKNGPTYLIIIIMPLNISNYHNLTAPIYPFPLPSSPPSLPPFPSPLSHN